MTMKATDCQDHRQKQTVDRIHNSRIVQLLLYNMTYMHSPSKPIKADEWYEVADACSECTFALHNARNWCSWQTNAANA